MREHVGRRGDKADVGKQEDVGGIRKRFKNVTGGSTRLDAEIVLRVMTHSHTAEQNLKSRRTVNQQAAMEEEGVTATHRHHAAHV